MMMFTFSVHSSDQTIRQTELLTDEKNHYPEQPSVEHHHEWWSLSLSFYWTQNTIKRRLHLNKKAIQLDDGVLKKPITYIHTCIYTYIADFCTYKIYVTNDLWVDEFNVLTIMIPRHVIITRFSFNSHSQSSINVELFVWVGLLLITFKTVAWK